VGWVKGGAPFDRGSLGLEKPNETMGAILKFLHNHPL
jgi:hypothetical protein